MQAAQELCVKGVGTAIITMGGRRGVGVQAGEFQFASLQSGSRRYHLQQETPLLGLAVALGERQDLRRACDFAQKAAALAVTKLVRRRRYHIGR